MVLSVFEAPAKFTCGNKSIHNNLCWSLSEGHPSIWPCQAKRDGERVTV